MPTYYDSSGFPHILTVEIGYGGEGTVFVCPNDSKLVAKIYHEPISSEKGEKLRWMAENKDDSLLKIAAWVVDILYDSKGNIVGFLMPSARAKEIHELYSLKSRRIHFPQSTWKFLLHAASNVARAFYVLHKHEHIMGDVNHGNLVVLADGTVKLIDCDSYSILTDKTRYRCEVGVATHLAPELQGVDLSEVEREFKHDNFGLAVIIFQLLFLGRHPFAGNYLGAEDKSLEDCIRERRFAYGDNSQITNVKQPPGTLSLSDVTPQIAKLFERAFFTDNRPQPREWIEALEDLSKNLKNCDVQEEHAYFAELFQCPWCRIESQTGLILFPSNSINEGRFNILTVENLVNQLSPTKVLPLQPSQFYFTPNPSFEALNVRNNKFFQFGIIVFVQIFILGFISVVISGGLAFFVGIFATLATVLVFNHLYKTQKDSYERDYDNKHAAWKYIEVEWNEFNSSAETFGNDLDKIRRQIGEHKKLQLEKAKQYKLLSNEEYQAQLKNYLSAFRLADFKAPEIEQIHYDTFNRYGLKTAGDISDKRLESLLAINQQIRQVLVDWRKDLEKGFSFDSSSELPVVAKNRLEIRYADKRGDIESNIEKMLANLRNAAANLQQSKHNLADNAEKSYREVIQAKKDLATVGGIAPLVIVMILVDIFVPTFVSPFNNSRSVLSEYPPAQIKKNSSGKEVVAKPVDISADFESNFTVNEEITDKEIGKISVVEREKSAKYLQREASRMISYNDNSRAEKYLKLAIRFDNQNKEILYDLGSLFYKEKKSAESIKFLQKILLLDADNEKAHLLIGANYLQMQKYNEARHKFSAAVLKNANSYEANYNLGITYQYMKKYAEALPFYQNAVKISPDDADAHYGYGLCLFKVGKTLEAEIEYFKVLDLEPSKAGKLGEIMGIDKRYPQGAGYK